ncbi:MAG: hypothetical protein CMC35_01515 [Flavobacteriaceae bacterium]|nr:hypothetical protein [Flavobacteriaceae bacterium]|tara:strand:+ start:23323 stop:24012 length:690 start_codon:yes stop_codon:yes gene_type:complete
MHQKLIVQSFEAAGQKQGVSKKFRRARVLSDYIEEVTVHSYTERSLADKYDDSLAGTRVELPDFVRDALCNYLGYESFESFQESEMLKPKPNTKTLKRRSWKLVSLTLLLIVAVGAMLWQYLTRERWMEWRDPRYEEVSFDAEKLRNGLLKLYKQERIEHFQRVEPNCDYEFFNLDGSPRLFYGKNHKKEYEWFTQLGEHPETGKPLKAITKYMIEKYICKSKEKNRQF